MKMNWFFGLKKIKKHRRKPNSVKARKDCLEKIKSSKSFYAVKLIQTNCKSSRKLKNKKFSFNHAPVLPLVRCDASECTCEYSGVDNKRQKNQRYIVRRLGARVENNDRRTTDRRSEDRQLLL
jgi:hypothetical protein